MKKAIVLAVCLLLVGLLAVNGTLAQGISSLFADLSSFFAGTNTSGTPQQDTDGTLDVQLVYQKRNDAGTALVGEGTPEQLAPARYSAFDWDNDKQNVGNVMLWDESKITGAVDKFTSVNNAGEKTAYIRTAFALDKYAYDNDIIHLNFNTADTENFSYSDWSQITIKGRPYMMMVVTCLKELKKEETTPPMLLQVAMSNDVTNADLANVSADFLQIKVMAIESDVFVETVDGKEVKLSATDALNMALPLKNLQPFQ